MTPTLWIIAAVAVVIVLAIVAIYNRLVALARRCDQSASDIDVQLKQRHDLIPSLVETVKGYATHERATLEEVMRARSAATAAPSAGAEAALSGALGRLLAVAEAYPDLKASQNFSALQDELSDIENKIAAARRFLNSATNEYNTTREQFPANIIASMFDFASRENVVIAKESRVTFETAPSIRF